MISDAFISTLAAVVGHGLWGSALILLVAAGILKLIQAGSGTNAATRHAIWSAALVGVVVLHMALAVAFWPSGGTVPAQAALEPASTLPSGDVLGASAPRPGAALIPSEPGTKTHGPAALPANPADPEVQPASGVVPADVGAADMERGDPAGSRAIIMLAGLWKPVLALVGLLWAMGILLLTARLGCALVRVRRLQSEAEALDSQTSHRILSRVQPGRRGLQLASCEVASPVAAGLGRPMVLLPRGLEATLGEQAFDQLVLHEVAHLARRDDWSMLIQRVIEALLWFNPAVHAIGRFLSLEREVASDEWVVAATSQPRAYADSLGALVELRLSGAGLVAVPGLAARESDLVKRVRRLLAQGSQVTSKRISEQAAVAIALVGLVIVLSVLQAPRFGVRAQVAPPVLPLLPPAPAVAPRPDLPPLPPVSEPKPTAPTPAEPSEPALPESPARVSAPIPATVLDLAPLSPVAAAPSLPPAVPTVAEPDLTINGWIRLFRVAKGIGSDGDRSRVLLEAVSRMPSNERVHLAFLDAAGAASSSGDKARVLMAFARGSELSKPVQLRLIETTTTIASSGERARTLIAIASGAADDVDVRDALVDAAEGIPGSGERARVLTAILR